MSTLSREAASAIIADVRADNGGISLEDRAATRESVLRALENVRRKLASATRILIDNLYSKETRFIYELIQNAEDNSYSNAIGLNEKPFLAFKVLTDRIVVDSNEDGFDENNVRAICSTGESTKANSEGYIGEKGVGFKSVFKIARRVHIQSGPFSFSFEHSGPKDDGLGMVTPMTEQHEELPARIRTRMTLMLLEGIDFHRLRTDFNDVPDTLLLFLRNLEEIRIEIHPPGNAASSVIYSKHGCSQAGLHVINLAKVTQISTVAQSTKQKYYVIKKKVRNLPFHAARIDKNGKSIDRATTVLAFPVTHDDRPILEEQHVFAFLPLRQAGFKFLIQSDFVTQANREDVVHISRNEEILTGIARAFRDAVLSFCNHETLRYQWMRFLPSDSIPDKFWGQLWPRLSDTLRKTSTLRSWSGDAVYVPTQMKYLTLDFRDSLGEPLLPDLEREIYLHPSYLFSDFKILQRLGSTKICWPDVVERLRADLKSTTSKWQSMSSNPDWRTRMCDLFSKMTGPSIWKQLKAMPLVPTVNGDWSSPDWRTLYFPDTNGVPVPADLRLDLVHEVAASNASWHTFLCHLGVVNCPPKVVIDSLVLRYASDAKATISLADSKAHLIYLYWNLPANKNLDPHIWLYDDKIRPVTRDYHLYFRHLEGQDSLVELFQKQKDHNIDLPGYDAHFLHPNYLDALDQHANRNGVSWLSWLESAADVRRNPQMYAKGSPRLSSEFEYIIKHRSERLLWILKRFWSTYENAMRSSTEKTFRESQVKVEGKAFSLPLDKTFLPLPKLRDLIREYRVPNFDFILMSPQPHGEDHEWKFLERLQVKFSDDLAFYLQAIAQIENGSRSTAIFDNETERAITHLYRHVQQRCNENLELVCSRFKNLPLLYIPAKERKAKMWAKKIDCVWDGPIWLCSKERLNNAAYSGLEALIKTILKIPDASLSDALTDLQEMKNTNKGDATKAQMIYDYLWDKIQSSQAGDSRNHLRKLLRDGFETSALIYVAHLKSWFRPSACVWAEDHIDIPGKVSIARIFESRKTFFTKALAVEEPTTTMFIRSLMSYADNQQKVAKIIETMTMISSLGVDVNDVAGLLRAKIFPIKLPNSQRRLVAASSMIESSEYVILDTMTHRNTFLGKVPHLDFSMEQLRDTRSFLITCGLEGRFTSNLVENVTEVEEGFMEINMAKELHSKALALVRCATHYTSSKQRQDPNKLCHTLQQATVYISDGISQSMKMCLNGSIIQGVKDRANFHLQESDLGLSFYLPKDEVDREVCFERFLPRRFMEYLKITNPSAESIFGTIFRTQKRTVIERILDDAGIAHVTVSKLLEQRDETCVEQPNGMPPEHRLEVVADRQLITSPRDQREEEGVNQQQQVEHVDLTRPQSPATPSRRIRNSPTPATPTTNQTTGLLMPTSGQARPVVSSNQNMYYGKVLENIVAAARCKAADDVSLEGGSRGSSSSFLARLTHEVLQQGFGDLSFDHDHRVGAAGELYVFEYLKNLQLANFSLKNWVSVIRGYAAAHPEYCNITKWSGRSLADIEYQDVEGHFTNLLIRKGQLEEAVWRLERPYYYFEVKATKSLDKKEPFFMSRAQYRHLQEMKIEGGRASPFVYVIIRIYGLGQGTTTGFDLYVDPETQRRQGRLDFEVETWRVTPRGTDSETLQQERETPLPRRESSTRTTPPIAVGASNGTPPSNNTQSTKSPSTEANLSDTLQSTIQQLSRLSISPPRV